MNTIWGHTINRVLYAALALSCALLWPATAGAAAPSGQYTFNGHTFHTDNARYTVPVTGGTAYVFDTGYTFNWSDYWGKFTSSTNGQRWWTYRGRSTSDTRVLNGCSYVPHRRGEFEIDYGYMMSCRGGASVARYVVRYRKAPPGFGCLKRGYNFWCSRFVRGKRQTAKFTYRPPVAQQVRHEMLEGTMECGAVSTGNGASGKPGKYVVFARDYRSCELAFSSHDRLQNMASYTAMTGAPGGEHHSIGDGINMACYKLPGHDSSLMCSGAGGCVILGRFSRGQFPRVYDGWAWSVIATSRIDPFSYC